MRPRTTVGLRPGAARPTTLTQKRLPAPKPDISLRPGLRGPPTTADLVIKRTFDGLSPAVAVSRVREALQNPIAAENREFVDEHIAGRVRSMQTVLNNVFTPGTPNRVFIDAQGAADITVLSSMTLSNEIVYQVNKGNQPPAYFVRAERGQFVSLAERPRFVIMEAEVTTAPKGLRMTYPPWSAPALSGPLSTIEEL